VATDDEPPSPSGLRHPLLWVIGALVVVALVAAIGGWLIYG
jgi:hypothetical protein